MYVKKFESETLDGALREIKKELGPDAIILKTVTNKGLKGAFKKKKIEITAAISEKSYLKKSKVDSVLDKEQKETFYSDQAGSISNMLDKYDDSSKKATSSEITGSYGKIGLNRPLKKVEGAAKEEFDKFLNKTPDKRPVMSFHKEEKKESGELSERVAELERALSDLTDKIKSLKREESRGVTELTIMLRGAGVGEKHIQELAKKAVSELPKEELEDSEGLYEFALREMLSKIKVEMPLFSKINTNSSPVVTVVLSRGQCGQGSSVCKLAALKSNSIIVKNGHIGEQLLAQNIYDIESLNSASLSEIVGHTRRGIEKGKAVFIDYKDDGREVNDIKKTIKGIKRSFLNVEILTCISSIHSEEYNRKILSLYGKFSDGIIITNLDICINYGHLFNLACEFKNVPFKFFGTGDVVPDDIESATGERVMAGLFQLN